MQKVSLLLPHVQKKKISLLNGTHEDYIRDEGDENIWLSNPIWKVFLTMSFSENKLPKLNTNRFNKEIDCHQCMINACRTPYHILPSARPDQLCHI